MNVKKIKETLIEAWLWLVAIVATMFIAFAIFTGIGTVVMGLIIWLE